MERPPASAGGLSCVCGGWAPPSGYRAAPVRVTAQALQAHGPGATVTDAMVLIGRDRAAQGRSPAWADLCPCRRQCPHGKRDSFPPRCYPRDNAGPGAGRRRLPDGHLGQVTFPTESTVPCAPVPRRRTAADGGGRPPGGCDAGRMHLRLVFSARFRHTS